MSVPVLLELSRREITQRRANALVSAHVVLEPVQLLMRVSIVLIVLQVNLFIFDGARQAFGVSVLPGLTDIDHTDPDTAGGAHLDTDSFHPRCFWFLRLDVSLAQRQRIGIHF
ncbi:MAG: hypothetical protein JXA89_13895 [Anaerolineae bacterium]|nr:hypothetical protein [Anaerolineae bacterium]